MKKSWAISSNRRLSHATRCQEHGRNPGATAERWRGPPRLRLDMLGQQRLKSPASMLFPRYGMGLACSLARKPRHLRERCIVCAARSDGCKPATLPLVVQKHPFPSESAPLHFQLQKKTVPLSLPKEEAADRRIPLAPHDLPAIHDQARRKLRPHKPASDTPQTRRWHRTILENIV